MRNQIAQRVSRRTRTASKTTNLIRQIRAVLNRVTDTDITGAVSLMDPRTLRGLEKAAQDFLSSMSAVEETSGGSGQLAQAIEASYRRATHYVQFRDGVVDIPWIYHDLKRKLQVSYAEYLEELKRMAQDRVLQLMIANDPGDVPDPDKGIRSGGKLLYYVMWL